MKIPPLHRIPARGFNWPAIWPRVSKGPAFPRLKWKVAGAILAVLCVLSAPLSRADDLDPDLQAYANRCNPPLDPYFLIAANRFIASGKAHGWWNNMSAVYFFCAPTQQATLFNVKDNSLSLTVSGSVAFTPYVGVQGDGTTGYLDTGVSPANIPGFTLGSHSMFIFCQTDSSSLAGAAGSNTGGYGVGIRPHNGNTSTLWSANNSGIVVSLTTTTALGLTGFVRTGTGGGFRIKNDVTADFTNRALGLPTVPFRFLRQGASSPPYSVDQLAFGFIGSGSITKEQAEDIYPSCVEMLSTLGTWSQMEPELVSFINRSPDVEEWDLNFIMAANRLIHDGKTHGWWQQMTGVYFLCAPSQQAALLNVKSDTLNLTVSGTVSFAPYIGAQGDGLSGYLDLGAKGTEIPGFTLDGHSMFVFCQSDNPGDSGEFGTLGGGASLGIRVRDDLQASIWSASSTKINLNVQSGRGLTGFVRTGTDGGFSVKNDNATTFSLSGTALPSGWMRFFRFGQSQYYSSNQLALGFIGGKITQQQAADLYTDCVNMLGDNGLGTLVPDDLDSAAPPHVFGRASENTDPNQTPVTPAGLRVFRWGPPPPSDTFSFAGIPPYDTGAKRGYVYGPLTDAEGRPWASGVTSTDTQVTRWERIWSDRANIGWATKPNDTMGALKTTAGQTCGTEFTSYCKAIGSTLVKTAYSAGLKFRHDPDYFALTGSDWGWGDIAEHWGYDVSAWEAKWEANQNDPIFSQDLDVDTGTIVHCAFCADASHIDSFFSFTSADGTYKTSHDQIILGPGRTADMPMAGGFIIDHEHADDRSPALEVQYVTEMAKIAHCKQFLLAGEGHAPNSGAGAHGGWTIDNAHQLLCLFDWYNISATASSTELADLTAQYDFFKGPNGNLPVPGDKLCLLLQIGAPGQEISLCDTATARQFMIDKGIPRCVILPIYATLGGALSRTPNQVIATFLGLPTQ